MLTNEDVKKITEANLEVNREIFATKEDFEELRQDFRKLQSAVDTYAQKADAYFQEMVMLSHKVDRLEKWILQIAEKTGVTLEH
jgi:uncharacterized coiled-coil DUF342 family protein